MKSSVTYPSGWPTGIRPKNSRRLFGVFTALLMIAVSAANGQAVNIRVHDPVMIKQGDTYHLYCTGRGISSWESKDLKNWVRSDSVFHLAPAWVKDVVPDFKNHIWAPDITFHDGQYYLYYAVSAFGKNTSAIGVATNKNLDPQNKDYQWIDHGIVVQSVPGRDMWNAIDPNVAFDDAGTPWMVFGSFWSGLKLVRLDKNMTKIAQPEEWYSVAGRDRYWKLEEEDAGDAMNGAIEAPFIFKKNGYYYLFASWDRCCAGKESTYKVVVGRSKMITGPYLDKEGEDMRVGGGSLVVGGNEKWPGVGHNAAYSFDGMEYLVFHGYDMSDEGRPKLWIRPIQWDASGWPTVTLD